MQEENDDPNRQEAILRKVTPIPNSQGVLVVEVDKVIRDLQMLIQSVK